MFTPRRRLYLDTKPIVSSPLALYVFTASQDSSPPPPPSPTPTPVLDRTLRSPSPLLDPALREEGTLTTLTAAASGALLILGEAAEDGESVHEQDTDSTMRVSREGKLERMDSGTDLALWRESPDVVESERETTGKREASASAMVSIAAQSDSFEDAAQSTSLSQPVPSSTPEISATNTAGIDQSAWGSLKATPTPLPPITFEPTPRTQQQAMTGSWSSMKPARSLLAASGNQDHYTVGTFVPSTCGVKRTMPCQGGQERYSGSRSAESVESVVDESEADFAQRASAVQLTTRKIAPMRGRSMQERLQGVE